MKSLSEGIQDLNKSLLHEEAGTGMVQKGEVRPGQLFTFGEHGDTMQFQVTGVSGDRVALSRVPDPNYRDPGRKLRGKGTKLNLQWDGTGYGKNALKRARPGQEMPKMYLRANGRIY